MKKEKADIVYLKKYDDTIKNKKSPPSQRKTKKSKARKPKLPPGQTTLAFKSKYINKGKTFKLPCYEESKLGWPEELLSRTISHKFDNDQESDEAIVSNEKQKCISQLMEEIIVKKLERLEDTIAF